MKICLRRSHSCGEWADECGEISMWEGPTGGCPGRGVPATGRRSRLRRSLPRPAPRRVPPRPTMPPRETTIRLGAALHDPEPAGVDQPLGLRGARRRDHEPVRDLQQIVEAFGGPTPRALPAAAPSGRRRRRTPPCRTPAPRAPPLGRCPPWPAPPSSSRPARRPSISASPSGGPSGPRSARGCNGRTTGSWRRRDRLSGSRGSRGYPVMTTGLSSSSGTRPKLVVEPDADVLVPLQPGRGEKRGAADRTEEDLGVRGLRELLLLAVGEGETRPRGRRRAGRRRTPPRGRML